MMNTVHSSVFYFDSLSKGKWGWCESSCYEDQLIDGFEYCGNHSYCSNSDDDSRGLTCGCDTGYTAHRIYFGQKDLGRKSDIKGLLNFTIQDVAISTSAPRVGINVE